MKSFVLRAACLFVWLGSALGSFAARPNVILILTDDQGYGDLSSHGNPVLKTPNLDRLRGESLRFTDFHVAPMCTPTRGQLMTGVDALRNGAMNVSSGRSLLRREFPTMPGIFAASGYRTAIFGKWHLGDNYPYRPQDRGFQESIWFPSSHIPSAAGYWNNDYFDDVYSHNGKAQAFEGYCTDVFFREAKAWMLDRSARREPFFCYLPLNAPHGPLFVPDHYREPYRQQKPNVASFFGMIANIDEQMGQLEEFLRQNELRENTILIFMTDNGGTAGVPVFKAGMRGKKMSLYDGGHRVPFFLRWPGGQLRSPADLGLLTQCQDVLPTLIDLCELKKPKAAKFDGLSLAPILRGKADAVPDRMLAIQYSHMDQPRPAKGDAAVLWNKWRLVSGKELYDISTDPGQERNLISQQPDVAAKMRKHYETWWAELEPSLNDLSLIHIGSDREIPALLTPCDWQDVFLDQQVQVRHGERKSGAWGLYVDSPGIYQFELRRWPVEADAAITAGLPEYKCVDGAYPAGQALPAAKARLKAGAFDQTKVVKPDDKQVTFEVSLKNGRVNLETWFQDVDGKPLCGAYYVYVRKPAGH